MTPDVIDPNSWAALMPTRAFIDDFSDATSPDSDLKADDACFVPDVRPLVSAVNIADIRDMPAIGHLLASNCALICGIFFNSSIISISV